MISVISVVQFGIGIGIGIEKRRMVTTEPTEKSWDCGIIDILLRFTP